jgi:signal transduction histidine kinase/ligand-binding sensor domain-containing protein
MRRGAFVFLAAVFSVNRAAPAIGLELSAIISDYRITSWAGGDGFALGEILSIAQDQDGYLWLASDGGLVRFDGIRFARSDIVAGPTQLPAAPTRAVYAARDGSLWVGYGNGRGLYRIVHGEVRNVQLENQINGLVNAIIEDRTGALWVGHDEGLLRLRNGGWAPVTLPAKGPGRKVWAIHEDRTGRLWVAATSGLYRQAATGEFEKIPDVDGIVRAIAEGPDGRLWINDERAGFRRADASDRTQLFEARGIRVFHDSRDNLWVTTVGQGVWQVRNVSGSGETLTVRRATAQTGLVGDESSAVFEDRDGNIWIGSIQGLNRLTPYKLMSLGELGVVRTLTMGKHGAAWVGTTTGLVELTGVTPHSPGKRRQVSTAGVRALHTSGDGRVWAGTDDGLYTVDDGRMKLVAPDGASLRRITSIASDHRGALWVCDGLQGLTRVANGRLERIHAASDDPTEWPVLAYVDDADRVWITYTSGIVRRLNPDGSVVQYGRAEGLTHSAIHTVHQDRSGNLWIGGTDGLSRLDGDRFHTITFHNEGPFRSIASVIDDDAGDLWVGIHLFGVVRVPRQEIPLAMSDASYPVRYRVYNASSGMGYPFQRVISNDSWRGADGALWFVTSRGVTVIDPRELQGSQDGAPGPPRIEGLTANDRRYSPEAGLILPPRTSRLKIDYTVMSLSSLERIRFRYRLDGFDTQWVDGTGPRQALYTNLPPGSYRFRLQASANSTTWNDAEADLSFSIRPMFYQTRWFYSVCAAALVLLGMWAWRLRMRQARKALALVYGERLRLSREIHDTLLQSLYGVGLQLDAAAHQLRDSPSFALVRAHLQRIQRQIEDYISEARQSIWDLRSPTLQRRNLIEALQHAGDSLTAGKVDFVLTVTGAPRACPSKLETHVLRIGHEAVMNAVRHADARRVEMEIEFDERLLRLRVADNGRGFDEKQTSKDGGVGHYGLMSMKERAADAGGRCTIESVPGAGVQVIAEFPIARSA